MSIASLDRKKYKVKEIIQSYLSLEKRGNNYWAICPFHDDSRASLSVSEERNIFKCFSCGVAGDAISFIMRREKINLEAALLRAHEILKLPTDDLKFLRKISPEEQLKKNLLKFNKFMLNFFSSSLKSPRGKDALNYLKQNRKLTDDIINSFGLGYSPLASEVIETLNNLQKVEPEYKFLTQEFLLQTGQFSLIDNKLVHNFRNKIVFPIYDDSDNVLSFSARSIKEIKGEPKYLHSKETVLFKKSEYLYNLPAIQKIKKDSFIYLFEGFFDVYAAYSLDPNGIFLALLGSQLSDIPLKMLSKLSSKKLVLALDNDDVGRDSTMKLFKKALVFGFEIYALPPYSTKDLAESYQLNDSIQLPKPILFVDWIDLNWTKLFEGEDNKNKLPLINQLVLSLLDILFLRKSSSNQLLLKPTIIPKNAISALNQIFQLYEIIELSENENKILKQFQSKYVEAVNLHLLSSNLPEQPLFEYHAKTQQKENNLVSKFSNIFESWEKLIKSNSSAIFVQTRRSQWESSLLTKYSSKLQLTLLPEERKFLETIIETINQLTNSLTPLGSHASSKEFSGEVLNFLELYYLIIHQLINRYEKLIKEGPKLNLKERIVVLDEIEKDKKSLDIQSAKVFEEIINWERSYKRS